MTDHDPGDEHPQTLADVLTEIGDRFDLDLSDWLEVAPSTVARWRRGTANPHPRLAAQVIRYALMLANESAKGGRR